jgi:hypothetical protein
MIDRNILRIQNFDETKLDITDITILNNKIFLCGKYLSDNIYQSGINEDSSFIFSYLDHQKWQRQDFGKGKLVQLKSILKDY